MRYIAMQKRVGIYVCASCNVGSKTRDTSLFPFFKKNFSFKTKSTDNIMSLYFYNSR